jgi:hypothetical protein
MITTSPGPAPATTRVGIWYVGPRLCSTAAAVSSFAVEAGVAGDPPSRSNSASPVATSTMDAVTRPPRPASASSGFTMPARPALVGRLASVLSPSSTAAAAPVSIPADHCTCGGGALCAATTADPVPSTTAAASAPTQRATGRRRGSSWST